MQLGVRLKKTLVRLPLSLEKRSRVRDFAYAPFGWEFGLPYLLLVPGRLSFVTQLAIHILSSANGLGAVYVSQV